MTEPLFGTNALNEAVHALRNDLLADGGPRISTMRNYRFAILAYEPTEEFKLRQKIHRLSQELRADGWGVHNISLYNLLLRRLHREESELLERLIEREKRLYEKDPDRALTDLRDKVAHFVEGPTGIAKDVVDVLDEFVETHPINPDKTVVFVGRAGALYPFFRSSALLKHLDGKTKNLPVVLLYPGIKEGVGALSFMGQLPADRDYRPRIYP